MSVSKKISALRVVEGTVEFRRGFNVALAKVEQLVRDSVRRQGTSKGPESERRGRYVKCGIGDTGVTFSVMWSLDDDCYKHTMYRGYSGVASVLSAHREISVDLQLHLIRGSSK